MGYTSSSSWNTLAKVLEQRIRDAADRYVTHKRIGNCLWMVKTSISDGKPFIALDLLSKHGGGWGYTDMSEIMFPYYYSCPLEFLGMCETECAEWRAEVRKWHARQTKIKQLKKTLKVGDVVNLIGCKIPSVIVQSLKPFTGSYNGKLYRLNWNIIDVEV